ncbi:hypothetical protein D3C78_1042580 [compost metagenome]
MFILLESRAAVQRIADWPSSLITTNRWGAFLGRLLNLDCQKRLKPQGQGLFVHDREEACI